jgi:uncharacterized membrane protein
MVGELTRGGRGLWTRPYVWLTAVWILVMISVPILGWTLGPDAVQTGVMLGVLFQAAAVLAILVDGWGVARTALTAAVVVPLTWAVEWLGSHTGFPFGAYSYTDALQPQLGHVPLLIPLAWLMMLPPAWAVAATLTGMGRTVAFVAVSALAFTAWDLFLDPQMVAWGYWVWHNPGLYFGIPLVNFGGWLLASALVTAAVQVLLRPTSLPVRPLLVFYTITWALQFIGQALFWAMVGPALIGGAAMGLFVFLAWRKVW